MEEAPETGNSKKELWTKWTSRKVHKVLLWVWLIAGAFVNFVLGWQQELAWISFMSLYAIVAAHWAGLDAAKAEEEIKPKGYNA